MTTHRPSVYDRIRPHLAAEDLVVRLGIQSSRRIGSELYCKPLCHESSSGESLQVNLHTGRWNCKACQHQGVFGDLIQLVEYAQTGGRAPAHGAQQSSSATHRAALRWLCEQYAVPYDEPGGHGVAGDPALDLVHMFSMLAHQHLLDHAPEVLDWVREKWGFDRATVEAYGIGYMPSPILPALAAEAARPEAKGAFRASGLGFYAQEGGAFVTRFEGRVTFPYLEHGRAVYMIGRATPWTPKPAEGRVAKYHKLTVHSEQRPWVSPKITNDHLYLEPVMDEADVVVVAEGVADAVALSSIGVPVVSPVTISFNEADLERFVRKCRERKVRRVEILFDNELSGSGNYGAARVGAKLVERGICVKVLTLPLGPKQAAARDEVLGAIGAEAFAELEHAEPRRRKEILAERVTDPARREWVASQVDASKIDAAEWVATEGAAAAEKIGAIRRAGVDVVEALAAQVACPPDADASDRIELFRDVVRLAACVDDRIVRAELAGVIARAAGKGISKADVMQRVAEARKRVKEERREEEDEAEAERDAGAAASMTLLPPVAVGAPALPPPPPKAGATPEPTPAGARADGGITEHDRYAPTRDAVMRAVEKKAAEEVVGRHVAQTITVSMGFTPFRTPEELVLVRGNERVDVGIGRTTPAFRRLIYLAAALTYSKSSHRGYVDSVVYFLELDATRVHDVSWSHFDRVTGAVHFPTGDAPGTIFRIEPGSVFKTRMADARVPAVAGATFRPFSYAADCSGAIDRVYELFRWTSISPSDRLLLVYWCACLPILRRVGEVPIVRIEGGSSAGKTRTIDAVAYLVNGAKTSAVPTAAAMTSSLAAEMLTIDDNRESRDMTDALRATLLQATSLGAKQKRKANSDTGTIVERVCGALIMNGIEPIHDGRSELASRMLTLRADAQWLAHDSPRANETFYGLVLDARDAFLSESVHRCAQALALDAVHGERLGAEVERIFGAARIGRLSSFLRLMYLAWVAGRPLDEQPALLERVAEPWARAFGGVGEFALQSLMHEELAVSAMRYAFAFGHASAEPPVQGAAERWAFDGKYREDTAGHGDAVLGPVSSAQLCRIVRAAAREMNAPRALAVDLNAGQLLARVQDGVGFLAGAGFAVEFLPPAAGGRVRMNVYRSGARDGLGAVATTEGAAAPSTATGDGGDTWRA